jgi:hypothetical protein
MIGPSKLRTLDKRTEHRRFTVRMRSPFRYKFNKEFHAHLNDEVSRRHSFWRSMWRIVNLMTEAAGIVAAI